MDDTKHSASLALAAYAESFLGGRRVVVFGDASSGLADLLVERGARLVHVYDTDAGRVARAIAVGASPNVSFAPLGPSGLPVRDGAFDVGIITNLASHKQPQELVNRLRRALSARGVGFVATPNAEQTPIFDPAPEAQGLTYYELYDLACAEFDEVRTLGQTPFLGYALADFGPDREETFTIDTALVPGGAEEPEWFIAVVSHFPINCEPFSVIQFPGAQLLGQADAAQGDPTQSDAARSADAATALEAAARLLSFEQGAAASSLLTAEIEKRAREAEQRSRGAEQGAADAAERTRGAEQRAVAAEKRVTELDRELQELRRKESPLDRTRELLVQARLELEKRDAWVSELEARRAEAEALSLNAQQESQQLKLQLELRAQQLATSVQAATQVQEELANLKTQFSDTRNKLRDAVNREQALSENQAETAKLLAAAEQRQAHVQKLEALLAETRTERDVVRSAGAEQEQENQTLEQQLHERGQVVSQLERDLRKTELFSAQLLRELEDLREQLAGEAAAGSSPSLPITQDAAADGAALANSAELRNLQNQVEQLAAVDARRLADLSAARWTISELETRLLESAPSAPLAEELTHARAELQRQAALLSQLGASAPDFEA